MIQITNINIEADNDTAINYTKKLTIHKTRLFVCCAVLWSCCSINVFAQTPVLDYHFDGNYQDSSSSTNHGIPNGNAMITTNSNNVAFGVGALSLNGSANSYVDLTSPIIFSDSQPWTIAFWAKRISSGDNMGMLMGDKTNKQSFIWLNDNFAGLRFRSSSNHTLDFSISQDIKWHHYALAADGTGQLTLYRDGSFQEILSGYTDFKITSIGRAYTSGTYSFNGNLDEIHIYTDILTSNEVYTIYTNEYSAPPPVIKVDKLRVFLLGGQSNADGRANPSGQPTYSDVDFYSDTESRSGTLTELYPGASETSGFGPELGFGRRITDILGCDSTTRVAIIKYANGGTSLYSDWRAGGDSTISNDGPEYVAFQQAVTDGLAALSAKYTSAVINIEGMLWMQGESDSLIPEESTNYYRNLTNFIFDVRATYGIRLPFVIGRLSTNQSGSAASLIQNIRNAQNSAAAESTLNGLVYTDSFPLQDEWHFNPSGQISLGKAFAAQMGYILWVTSQLSSTDIDTGKGEPDADPDEDGISNINEFYSGTDITNAGSRFSVSVDLFADNVLDISYPSHAGRMYQLESCTNIMNDVWTNIIPYTNGTTGTMTYRITNDLGKTFFRVRSRLP